MAPELIRTDDEGKSGLSTNASDAFALGMVTFEVSDVHRERLSRGCGTPSLHPFRFSPVGCRSQRIGPQ